MANKKKWTHKVTESLPQTRIVDYCGAIFPILGSKSATKKAISAGRIRLNGEVASSGNYVKQGDLIEVVGSGIRKIKKLDIDLPIVFEDDYLIIVNKPGGIAVNGNRYKTVENALVDKSSSQADALPRPVAAHRIDVPTKGLVLLAKTKRTLTKLGQAFQANRIQKTYYAVVHGKITESGAIHSPIDGKKAHTTYKRISCAPSQKFGHLSLVQLGLETGRTHQLRIHLNALGHLVVGDKLYAEEKPTILGKGLYLAACALRFEHPQLEKQMHIHIDPPDKFLKLLEREKARY